MEVKSKFNIHDKIWYMQNNKPTEGRITGIAFQVGERCLVSVHEPATVNFKEGSVTYHFKFGGDINEVNAFENKIGLINSLFKA